MKKIVVIMGVIIVILSIALYAKKVLHINLSRILNPVYVIQNLVVEPSPSTASSQLKIQIYADNLPNARVIAFDSNGVPLVSLTSRGTVVALPDMDLDLKSDRTIILIDKLNQPHGLAFSGDTLYVAETNQVSSYQYDPKTFTISSRKILFSLPSGGGHFTRSLLIKDGYLYTAVGSSCNVCRESQPHRAAILRSNLDGSDLEIFSAGLRNSVFQTVNPATGEIWVTEMGRDNLGDNLPPDEINILSENGNFGWPVCYGQNIHDSEFDKNQYIQNPCNSSLTSRIDLPAHSAPLGLSFFPAAWPGKFQSKLLVAFHGSWNRSVPTGYRLVTLDPASGQIEDFLTSQTYPKFISRPVDVKFNSQDQLFVSDDKLNHLLIIYPESDIL